MRILVANGHCVHECGVHLPDSIHRRKGLTPHDFHRCERPSTQLASAQLAASAVTKCVRGASTREHERVVRAARERKRAETAQLAERSREELRGARAWPGSGSGSGFGFGVGFGFELRGARAVPKLP
jgi:hypothetical protein